MNKTYKSDVEAADDLKASYLRLRSEIGKVIIGQDEVVKDVTSTLITYNIPWARLCKVRSTELTELLEVCEV